MQQHCFCMLVINCQLVHICPFQTHSAYRHKQTHTHVHTSTPRSLIIHMFSVSFFLFLLFVLNEAYFFFKKKVRLINRNVDFPPNVNTSARDFFSSNWLLLLFLFSDGFYTCFLYCLLRFNGQMNASKFTHTHSSERRRKKGPNEGEAS